MKKCPPGVICIENLSMFFMAVCVVIVVYLFYNNMNNQNIVVFLNEEFGYRTFEWHPMMTQEEFVNWWQNLNDSDIIKYYFNMKSLPGSLTQINPNENGNARIRIHGDPKNYTPEFYCHFHDVDDSFIEMNETRIPYRRTTRRDWKENWVDYQIKNRKEEPVI